MSAAALDVTGLSAGYGPFQALFDLTLHAPAGSRTAIVGANGAGKSTLLRAILGQVTVTGGDIAFDGRSLRGVRPHRRAKAGIALVPEGRHVFGDMSVADNLRVGAHLGRSGRWDLDAVLGAFPLLAELLDRPAGVLSGGQKQALAIGRALMANPRVLLLDEVSLGLAPIVVRDLYASVAEIAATGTTVVVVEQDLTQALGFADHVHCLLEGRIVLSGSPDELSLDEIRDAYFGVRVA
ncbi:MAG: ABC transporter ATP-binding protein [Acidimicrobiales bacterium]